MSKNSGLGFNIMSKLLSPLSMLPTPLNINIWWNFGSMLGVFLFIQVVSGIFLSMHYCPHVDYAFNSVVHIMKDVSSGWLLRLVHMNGASFYFICIYIHISRNLYYQSFKLVHVWMVGVTILFLSMAAAFMGYVLPWGQMSFWGATVITNLLSAIPYVGQILVEWIWGGFSINNATLNRFFSFHFIVPLIILILVVVHIILLHETGSSNPMGYSSDTNKIPFHPYFTIKDMYMFVLILMFFMLIISQFPYYLGDPDNFKLANSMSTPAHIKPEWYFLFAYSILRSIPNKLGGVLMLLMSILILYFLPLYNNHVKTNKFYPFNRYYYWFFVVSFIMLTWLGSEVIEFPYVELNILFTLMYFIYYLVSYFIYKFWDDLLYDFNV
uniref:Cytochrome b n=1 Tax=Amegilla calceifera TaxID=597987 RepID=A0A7U0R6K2_9HYME|nr:cytochrome b [Amegilla calceifera]QQX28010.1 cytochrome b [Amegilla calceifera]